MDLKEIALNKSKKRHPWELARLRVVTSILEQYIDPNNKINVLDVGSGDIFLIKQLAKHYKNAGFFAVDIGYSDAYIQSENKINEEEKINIKLFNDLLAASAAIDGPVHLVLLLDVIEHVPDDRQFLLELTRLSKINKETLFLITVPAFQGLFCSHDVFLGHYRRYNNTLLQQTANMANLKVINIGYFFSMLLLPRMIQLLLEKTLRKNDTPSGIGNWEGDQFSSKLLERILVIDFEVSSFLRRLSVRLPGLSNYAVCKIYVS